MWLTWLQNGVLGVNANLYVVVWKTMKGILEDVITTTSARCFYKHHRNHLKPSKGNNRSMPDRTVTTYGVNSNLAACLLRCVCVWVCVAQCLSRNGKTKESFRLRYRRVILETFRGKNNAVNKEMQGNSQLSLCRFMKWWGLDLKWVESHGLLSFKKLNFTSNSYYNYIYFTRLTLPHTFSKTKTTGK